MRHVTRFTRFTETLVTLAILTAAASAQGRIVALAIEPDFSDRIKAYVGLQKMAEKTLPPMKSSKDEAEIKAHQTALRMQIMELRRQARQGDIFTKDISAEFRKRVRAVIKAPEGETVRRTIAEGDAAKPFTLQVNGIYPDTSPLQTTPPTVLKVLPELPMELSYRFVGRTLVLLDNKTNLVVDFLPEALP